MWVGDEPTRRRLSCAEAMVEAPRIKRRLQRVDFVIIVVVVKVVLFKRIASVESAKCFYLVRWKL